jgi:hypothetical protein
MTNLLTQECLSEIARVTTEQPKPLARPVVTMRWTIDARTGRPIGRWVIGDAPGAEDFPPAARR